MIILSPCGELILGGALFTVSGDHLIALAIPESLYGS